MLYIIDRSIDPWWNLAAEEYLFKEFKEPVFRLWQNDNAIIIGLHQNAYAEINLDFVRENNIKVVRRLTGGGAVFHDMGNVNFTFIDNKEKGEESSAMFSRFTRPILDALNKLKVNASLEGRNDLVIDGKKFSGNAIAVFGNRVLQHGTLLFSSSIRDLSSALAGRPEKFVSKSVKSNAARVTNISEHLKFAMSIEEFIAFLEREITSEKGYRIYNYTREDLGAIKELRDKRYSQDSWNYGSAPGYSFSKVRQFAGGLLELYMEVKKGKISEIKIYGSYFFLKETSEVEELLQGADHTESGICESLEKINLSDYFVNIAREEFLSLFWD